MELVGDGISDGVTLAVGHGFVGLIERKGKI